jgi:5-methylcytosine-specific restriction endonuclease McrA
MTHDCRTNRVNEDDQTCWLCGRPLGRKIEWHHPVPRSRGGRATVPLHPICHRTIHAALTNAELAKLGADVAAVRRVEEVARFVRWVAGKPPDFHAPTRKRK